MLYKQRYSIKVSAAAPWCLPSQGFFEGSWKRFSIYFHSFNEQEEMSANALVVESFSLPWAKVTSSQRQYREMFGNSLHVVPSISFFFVAGEMVTKQPLIRSMRTVKRETLKLISGWVSRSNDPQMVRNCSDILWVHITAGKKINFSKLFLKHNGLILGL